MPLINHPRGGYRLGAYRETVVPAPFERYAEVAWSWAPEDVGRTHAPAVVHRVIPETGLSLCFDAIRDARGRLDHAALSVMGPVRSARLYAPRGRVRTDAIRIRPEWARELLGVDPGEVEDLVACGHREMDRRFPGLRDALGRTRCAAEPPALLMAALGRRVETTRFSAAAELAHRVMEPVRRHPARGLRLSDRARAVGVSERHLRRVGRAATGAGLKRFQRVRRLHLAVSLAEAEAERGSATEGWAAIALRAGYTDQAHAIREFRELTGLTPVRLLAERAIQAAPEAGPPMSGFYKTGAPPGP